MIHPLPRPRKADRVVERAQRKAAGRSATTLNPNGATIPKPQVWHCAEYRAWARKRYECGVKDSPLHVCGPRVDGKAIKHASHPEPEGKGLKASDHRLVIFCEYAHIEQHQIGWQTFQSRHNFDRDATARRIFESSPWFGRVEVVWP